MGFLKLVQVIQLDGQGFSYFNNEFLNSVGLEFTKCLIQSRNSRSVMLCSTNGIT